MGSCNSCYQDKNKEVITKDKVIISHSEQKENVLHRILYSRPPIELLPNLQPKPSIGRHLATS